MRVTVRVRPGASRDRVGGSHDGALVVAVGARAVDGEANRAALAVIAVAFGVRTRAVHLVSGERNRTKVVEVDGDPQVLARRLLELVEPSG